MVGGCNSRELKQIDRVSYDDSYNEISASVHICLEEQMSF